MDNRKYLVSGLKELRANERIKVHQCCGICHNMLCYLARTSVNPWFERKRLSDYLKQKMQQWPEYSGDPTYPIHTNKSIHPGDQYTKYGYREDLWSNRHPYGRARLRLVDWLIEKLELELQDGNSAETNVSP